jgi:hypothetical protein
MFVYQVPNVNAIRKLLMDFNSRFYVDDVCVTLAPPKEYRVAAAG